MAKPAHTKHIILTPSRNGFTAKKRQDARRFDRRSDIDQRHEDMRLARTLRELWD